MQQVTDLHILRKLSMNLILPFSRGGQAGSVPECARANLMFSASTTVLLCFNFAMH